MTLISIFLFQTSGSCVRREEVEKKGLFYDKIRPRGRLTYVSVSKSTYCKYLPYPMLTSE